MEQLHHSVPAHQVRTRHTKPVDYRAVAIAGFCHNIKLVESQLQQIRTERATEPVKEGYGKGLQDGSYLSLQNVLVYLKASLTRLQNAE